MHYIDPNPLMQALQMTEDNPLTRGLPAQRGRLQIGKDLKNRPITQKNVLQIPFDKRIQLVDTFKTIFAPTSTSIIAATEIQKLVYSGLNFRNPLIRANRDFIINTSRLKGSDISNLPWFPPAASGSVIDGITGTGKSQLIERILSLFPQIVSHGSGEEYGWKSMTQLVYLVVHMPSDGSRGGFLELAFMALDKALGTNYRKEFSSPRWTIEKLLVVFLHLLTVHRCGLLVIEEAQEQNLAGARFGREFLTFFLRIMNWGIPTVIVGNPLAFDELNNFSQDVDRFSEGGWHHLWPALSPDSKEWKEDWIPNLWLPTLLDEPDAPYLPQTKGFEQTLEEFVWRRTGGVPRYVCRLRREVQEHALRNRIQRIDANLVERIYRQSPKMKKLHPRIDALTTKDWQALKRFTDMPSQQFRQLWGPPPSNPPAPSDSSNVSATAASPSGDTAPKKKARASAGNAKPRSKGTDFQRAQMDQIRNAAYGKGP